MKRIVALVLSLLLLAALSLSVASCATTAYWSEQKKQTKGNQSDITKANGSEKYIVYAALDSSGALIPAGSATTASAYAVVGYTGLVAELVIPAQYDGKNVTKVIAATPYSDYKCYRNGAAYTGDDARLQNNKVVTSIVFGENVTFVGAGVCMGMTNLQTAYFDRTSGFTYEGAFTGLSPVITHK